ncbi:MAG: hypothetical protein KKA05_07055 [Alphaproteobacteria bacterium]|nr:hypothetical protein [Alphaproteobacteria bacterium]
MGSITSRPNIPAQQQQPVIVTVPQQPVYTYVPPPVENNYTPPVTTTPTPAPSPTENPVAPPVSEEAKSAARSEGLLNRNRGVLGTVMTSFRGLLSQSANATRKTLLGE